MATPTLLGSVASGSGSNTGSDNTLSHTLSAGSNRLVVGFEFHSGSPGIASTGATYGGTSMTRIGGAQYQNFWAIGLYVIKESSLPANGSNTFSVSRGGSAGGTYALMCATFDDVDQTTTYRTPPSQGNGTDSNPRITATSVSGDLVVVWAAVYRAAIAVASGTTSVAELEALLSPANQSVGIGSATATSTSTTLGFDGSGGGTGEWGTLGLSLVSGPGGGGGIALSGSAITPGLQVPSLSLAIEL